MKNGDIPHELLNDEPLTIGDTCLWCGGDVPQEYNRVDVHEHTEGKDQVAHRSCWFEEGLFDQVDVKRLCPNCDGLSDWRPGGYTGTWRICATCGDLYENGPTLEEAFE